MTTASVYYKKIDINYPTAGRDNDSQGFRDNFNNIKLALEATDNLVGEINLGLVKTSSTVTNFNHNKIKRANFQDCSVNVYDDTDNVRSQAIAVDYSNGSYQKFLVSNGTTAFNVINWPYDAGNPKGLQGSLVLSITPDNAGYTILDFGNYIPVGNTVNPFTFDTDETMFFELWSDDSGATVYINQIGYKTGIVATGTTLVATDSIKIGTNRYRTGTDFSTVIYVDNGTDVKVGDVAVIKDIFRTTIDPSTVGPIDIGTTVSNYFVVADAKGIFKGAVIEFTGTNTAYVVDHVTPSGNTLTNTATVYTVNSFGVNPAPFSTGSVVTFTNPMFDNVPILSIFNTATMTNTVGKAGDFKGMIHANSTTFYAAWEDHKNVTNNWVKCYGSDYIDTTVSAILAARQLASGTTAETVSTSTDNQVLATTAFVHNVLPKQSIIMWGGAPSAIPWGWSLCDGSTVNGVTTPDLRNRFIIASDVNSGGTPTTSITGSPTTTGGSKDAILVQHNHIATVTDPGHSHTYTTKQGTQPQSGDATEVWWNEATAETGQSFTDISVGISTEGTSGTNKNLPPYYALCYIMKVI